MAALFFSCIEQEILETVVEKEVFARHEHYQFNYANVNVIGLQTIGDRLMYGHRTNPGYIESNGEVVSLCCSAQNHPEVRQAFSEKFIIAVGDNMSYVAVYATDNRRHGYIHFNSYLDIHADKNTSIHSGSGYNKLAINGDHLIASMREGLENKIFIYNLENHTNFYGRPAKSDGVIEVDFSPFLDEGYTKGARIFHVDAFEEGWLVMVSFNQVSHSGTFFIRKDGSLQKLTLPGNERFFYTGHTIMDNGQLFLINNQSIYVSRSGELEDLTPLAYTNSNVRIASVGNRLLIYLPSFHAIYEVEGILEEEAEGYSLTRLDDTNLTFSNINDIQAFKDKVYVATSMGLFSKSTEAFWDEHEETEGITSQNFAGEVQWVK